jgi:excisionase family DNA binding protein
MSTGDVPGCLPVNRRTIYRLIKSGNLPAVRIGGQWRFRRSDLDAWIDRQRTSVRRQPVKPTAGMHASG